MMRRMMKGRVWEMEMKMPKRWETETPVSRWITSRYAHTE